MRTPLDPSMIKAYLPLDSSIDPQPTFSVENPNVPGILPENRSGRVFVNSGLSTTADTAPKFRVFDRTRSEQFTRIRPSFYPFHHVRARALQLRQRCHTSSLSFIISWSIFIPFYIPRFILYLSLYVQDTWKGGYEHHGLAPQGFEKRGQL